MKFLIVGLGSMGKRRIRNLKALDQHNIVGFDCNQQRAKQVSDEHNIKVYNDIDNALKDFKPDAMIISTWPDCHMHYAAIAEKQKIHCFIEASVVEEDKILELYQRIKNSNLVYAPSCTLIFTPWVKKISELVKNNYIGSVLNFNYHTGQYLPDWHPWEDINDYYVSKTLTGGCREIVPFELTWLSKLFGMPEPLALVKTKLSNIPAPIDDIYHGVLKFDKNILGNITIEVLSRPCATRELRIIGTEGIITFSGESNLIRYINHQENKWYDFEIEKGTNEKGYINPEEPYIAEMQAFINAINMPVQHSFPNTLLEDYQVLETLNRMEAVAVHE